MKLEALHRRCQERVRQLDLPAPFDVWQFSQTVSKRRQREIVLHAVASAAGLTGVCVAAGNKDFILYERRTSPPHQQHIILHELSHLVCAHAPTTVEQDELPHLLFPEPSEEALRQILRRASYSDEQEQEAELLASIILEQTGEEWPAAQRVSDHATAAALRRLEASLVGSATDRP